MRESSLSGLPKSGLAGLKENWRSDLLSGFSGFSYCLASVPGYIDGLRFSAIGRHYHGDYRRGAGFAYQRVVYNH